MDKKLDEGWLPEILNEATVRHEALVKLEALSIAQAKQFVDGIVLPRLQSAVVVIHKGRLLLGKSKAEGATKGKWVLPVATVQPFEGTDLAGARGVKEQTGLVVKPGGYLFVHEFVGTPNEHNVIVYRQADFKGGKLAPGGDLSEVMWADADTILLAAKDLSPLTKDAIRQLNVFPVLTTPAAQPGRAYPLPPQK